MLEIRNGSMLSKNVAGFATRKSGPISFAAIEAKDMRIAVTGAYGFSGKYIARRLLDLEHDVITLTNSPHRGNPFGESVKAFPYNFSKPRELEDSLRGVDVLINTYWVRFYKPPYFSFAQAVANAKVLFDSAKRAGVRRVIHISITNPDRGSDLP